MFTIWYKDVVKIKLGWATLDSIQQPVFNYTRSKVQSFPNTMRGYRQLSLTALAALLAVKRVRILTLLPNTHCYSSSVSLSNLT